LVDCILDCVNELPDPALRRSALEGVLLSGGGACIPGIHERVMHELKAQLPSDQSPRMSFPPEYMLLPTPQHMAWLGGAIMAKMVAYNSHWMIKAEYEELGPSAVHRKCA
jgi:actin-related protein